MSENPSVVQKLMELEGVIAGSVENIEDMLMSDIKGRITASDLSLVGAVETWGIIEEQIDDAFGQILVCSALVQRRDDEDGSIGRYLKKHPDFVGIYLGGEWPNWISKPQGDE